MKKLCVGWMCRLFVAISSLAVVAAVLASNPVAADTPTTPRSVVATSGADGIQVSWRAPSADGDAGPVSYLVVLSEDGSELSRTLTSDRNITFQRPAPGTYRVSVRATNIDGESGQVRRTVEVEPLQPPSNPRSVLVEVTEGGLFVTWRDPSTDGDLPVSGYDVVLRTLDNEVVSEVRVDADARSATVDLQPGQYLVGVRARSDAGVSGWVSRVIDVTGPPSMPLNVRVDVGEAGDVTVRWAEPASDGGGGISGYRVSLDGRSVDAGPARRGVRFPDVARGEHTIEVQAKSEAGLGPVAVVDWDNIVAPSAPRLVSTTVEGASATVSWAKPSDDGGEVTSYEVTVGSSLVEVGSGTTTATFDLLAAADFSVRVRAINRAGASGWVNGSAISIRKPPGRPRNVEVDVVAQRLTVTWAAPADDGNSAVTGYRIQYGGIDEIVSGTSFTRDDVPSTVDDVEISAINQVGEGPTASAGSLEIFRVFEPFDNSAEFVGQVYADFLGRRPDRPGQAYWEDRLNTTDDMAPLVISIARAPELDAERRLARLYLALFDRAPDLAGLDYWVQEFEQGQTLPSISEQFVYSPEFLERFGALDNAEFVVLVYNRVLARQPDQAGFTHWVTQLDAGVGRGELISLFAESPEFVAKSKPAVDLIVVYDGLLRRPPQHSELTSGLALVSAAGSIEAVISEILNSVEYQARVTD